MKVIVAGSREGFVRKDVFNAIIASPFHGKITEVVSGNARGVDRDGEYYAFAHALPVTKFLPDWGKEGKKAGMLRNIQMGNYADALIAVWDGQSKGTKQMITYMQGLNKPVYIYTGPNENPTH